MKEALGTYVLHVRLEAGAQAVDTHVHNDQLVCADCRLHGVLQCASVLAEHKRSERGVLTGQLPCSLPLPVFSLMKSLGSSSLQ